MIQIFLYWCLLYALHSSNRETGNTLKWTCSLMRTEVLVWNNELAIEVDLDKFFYSYYNRVYLNIVGRRPS